MGVYIKGMKMPKDCRECPMQVYYSSGKTWCKSTDMILSEDYKPIPFDGRPEWCPLVEVPEPHGRLIESPDISEYEVFDEDTGTREISLLGLMECHRMVKDAPTVIEAEGE
jgi:hypothetical protein